MKRYNGARGNLKDVPSWLLWLLIALAIVGIASHEPLAPFLHITPHDTDWIGWNILTWIGIVATAIFVVPETVRRLREPPNVPK